MHSRDHQKRLTTHVEGISWNYREVQDALWKKIHKEHYIDHQSEHWKIDRHHAKTEVEQRYYSPAVGIFRRHLHFDHKSQQYCYTLFSRKMSAIRVYFSSLQVNQLELYRETWADVLCMNKYLKQDQVANFCEITINKNLLKYFSQDRRMGGPCHGDVHRICCWILPFCF